jgi:hypothetical protein
MIKSLVGRRGNGWGERCIDGGSYVNTTGWPFPRAPWCNCDNIVFVFLSTFATQDKGRRQMNRKQTENRQKQTCEKAMCMEQFLSGRLYRNETSFV